MLGLLSEDINVRWASLTHSFLSSLQFSMKSHGSLDLLHSGVSDGSVDYLKDFHFFAEVTLCRKFMYPNTIFQIIPWYIRVISQEDPG